jgi:hypothetical protein
MISPGDPTRAGEKLFTDSRRVIIDAEAAEIWPVLASIGGEVGWYYANWLWQLRGMIDQVFGGVGLSRGRRDPQKVSPGDPLDFWRVAEVEPPYLLLLKAEMKLPGEAMLCFKLQPLDDGRTELRLIARFLSRGLLGLAYWYGVTPFHSYTFDGMLRGIANAAQAPISSGPERFQEKGRQITGWKNF